MTTVVWMHNSSVPIYNTHQIYVGKSNELAVVERRQLWIQGIKRTYDPLAIHSNPKRHCAIAHHFPYFVWGVQIQPFLVLHILFNMGQQFYEWLCVFLGSFSDDYQDILPYSAAVR